MIEVLNILTQAGIAVETRHGGKLVLRGLAALPEDKARDMVALAKENKDNILKVLSAVCPYTPEQLAAFGQSYPHLVCCPETKPAWGWRYRADCPRCGKPNCRHADIEDV